MELRQKVVERQGIDSLFETLLGMGYVVIGPTVQDAAIVYSRIQSTDDLPVGWTDEQGAGRYRLRRRTDEALFGYAVGQHSWKEWLFPPRTNLFKVDRVDGSLQFVADDGAQERFAFIGVRSCELAAIAIQDRVFLGSGITDRTYRERRQELFTVAVNCMVAGGTCFCVSMETGPRCTSGYDLVLTEVIDGRGHRFVVEAGSDAGRHVLDLIPGSAAGEADLSDVERTVAATASSMGRSMDTAGIKELLYDSVESPRWDQVAERCLACTNCTLVCPTCFCSTTEDRVSLDGSEAVRSRRWDSCFTMDFSTLHGVPVRGSTKARYRQWITHKLAAWHDQFGSSGCVGCGRCIAWCPVGIDITEEVAALRAAGMASP